MLTEAASCHHAAVRAATSRPSSHHIRSGTTCGLWRASGVTGRVAEHTTRPRVGPRIFEFGSASRFGSLLCFARASLTTTDAAAGPGPALTPSPECSSEATRRGHAKKRRATAKSRYHVAAAVITTPRARGATPRRRRPRAAPPATRAALLRRGGRLVAPALFAGAGRTGRSARRSSKFSEAPGPFVDRLRRVAAAQRKTPPVAEVVELALEDAVLRVLVASTGCARAPRGRDDDVAPAPRMTSEPLLDHALELGHEGDRAPLLLVRRRHGRRHDGRRHNRRRPRKARQRAARRQRGPAAARTAARGPAAAPTAAAVASRRALVRPRRRAARGPAPNRPSTGAAAARAPAAAPPAGAGAGTTPRRRRRRADDGHHGQPARPGRAARMAASSRGLHRVARRAAAAATGVPRRRAAS